MLLAGMKFFLTIDLGLVCAPYMKLSRAHGRGTFWPSLYQLGLPQGCGGDEVGRCGFGSGFRCKEIFMDVDSHASGRSLGPQARPEAGGRRVDWTLLTTLLEAHHRPGALWSCAVTSCAVLACVLEIVAEKCWRSLLSSLTDVGPCAHALEMIKRERKEIKQNQSRKTKHLPSKLLGE